MNNRVLYILVFLSFILHGCYSNNYVNNEYDVRKQSYLSWKIGGKKETSKLLNKKTKMNERIKKDNEYLSKKNKELDGEIEILEYEMKSIIREVNQYYKNIEQGVDIENNILNIENSLDVYIEKIDKFARTVNAGKLLYKIQEAKDIKRKISVMKKGGSKLLQKTFLRIFPGSTIGVLLWDLYDMLQPIKKEGIVRIKR